MKRIAAVVFAPFSDAALDPWLKTLCGYLEGIHLPAVVIVEEDEGGVYSFLDLRFSDLMSSSLIRVRIVLIILLSLHSEEIH